jgi:hypothetical protein
MTDQELEFYIKRLKELDREVKYIMSILLQGKASFNEYIEAEKKYNQLKDELFRRVNNDNT